MAYRGRYAAGLAGWLILVIAATFALIWSVQTAGLGAVRVVAALAWIAATAGLWKHVSRTNLQLARFVESIRLGDLSQNFQAESGGSGFDEVSRALNDAIRRLRDQRHQASDANRFYEAVLDDAPTALLIIDEQGRVELGNKAARRLFMKHRGVRIDDFGRYGDALVQCLRESSVGRPRLVPLDFDGMPQTAMVSASIVHRLGGLVRVVAVQPIQSELNAVEIAAQSDLIRVLTHEIMNSMTPVTSLAQTAADLVARADKGDSCDVADARVAVETLAKRADGVMHFVESYRQISRAPTIRRREFAVTPWAAELATMFEASRICEGLRFEMTVQPEELVMDADPDLLFQVLINLLRNGAEAACKHSDSPQVTLGFARAADGLVSIDVADNGPGVAESLRQDVFLPFFTTKQEGTGIGLSLARQIVLAHHGSIALENGASGGATFRLFI